MKTLYRTVYRLNPGLDDRLCLRWGENFSLLIRQKHLLIHTLLTLVLAGLMLFALGAGASSIGFAEVLSLLTGTATPGTELVITQWRAPRIVLAVVIGAALGVSGSIFQTMTRNPLGSPDLMGFTMGAQTGILTAIILFQASYATVAAWALIGGILSGAIIFSLAFRGGFGGLRLVLAGIALSSMLGSFNRWLIVQADSDTAYGAVKAVTGSLSHAGWDTALPTLILIGLLLILLIPISRSLRNYPLGDHLLIALGSRLRSEQPLLMLLGISLVAVSTVAAGPLSFIALVAPHLARLMYSATRAPLYASAIVGALLLLGADVLSQTALESLPVGIVTASVGGLYFMGLLLVEMRKKNA